MSKRQKTDFTAKLAACQGTDAPDWIVVLAEEASRTSATAVAKRIGYSASAVSSLISGKYPGDIGKIEAKVRGALMGATVECPVLGELTRDRCLGEQDRPFTANALRSRLYRACRNGCPHSRLGEGS